MTTNDGGPAFPVHADNLNVGDAAFDVISGMTLRDYFAAKFMDVAAETEAMHPTGDGGSPTYAGMANRCYLMADAMLKARES